MAEKNIKEEEINLEDEKYQEKYDEKTFLNKLGSVVKKVGLKGVYYLLILYFTMKKKGIPPKEKSIIIGIKYPKAPIIIGALGYFILPLDILPDITPLVGYTDDLVALGLALAKVAPYIDDDVKAKAKAAVKKLFKTTDEELDKFL